MKFEEIYFGYSFNVDMIMDKVIKHDPHKDLCEYFIWSLLQRPVQDILNFEVRIPIVMDLKERLGVE